MIAGGSTIMPSGNATVAGGTPMSSGRNPQIKHGFGFARFVLVISSLSPLFLLWSIRGTKSLDDVYWAPFCLAMFVLPNFFLWLLIRRARSSANNMTFKIRSARDQREHLLVYLFAMLIPLYDANMGENRDLAAVAVAFVFVAFLFWHLKLHYMNVFFAIKGYHIFTVEVQSKAASEATDSPLFATYAVISRRERLEEGMTISGLRLGGNVILDAHRNDRAGI